MRKIELQFPNEDDSFNNAVQAANEEKQERAEETDVETEAAANEDMPRAQALHSRTLSEVKRDQVIKG